jgi:subtilase family serine protease
MVLRQGWRSWLGQQWQIVNFRQVRFERRARFRQLVLERLEDRTVLSHATTNFIAHPLNSPKFIPQGQGSGSGGTFLPADIQAAYAISSLISAGDNGAGQTIAVVDAYNDPDVTSDLATFSTDAGLPQLTGGANGTFKVVNENGGTTLPGTDPSDPRGSRNNPGWALEESLDVEWSHAIAPEANIILVEASSTSDSDLNTGVDWAAKSVADGGGGASVISMSYGSAGGESDETSEDAAFSAATYPGVTFLASAGDDGSVNGKSGKDATNGQADYPADSPNVIAVGGTSLTITGSDSSGNYFPYKSESVWNDGFDSSTGFYEATGGGLSGYESQPSYQQGLTIHNGSSTISAGGMRAAPDVAFLADPDTGVFVIDSFDDPGGSYEVGGTSLSSPSWAGLIAITDQIRANHGLSPLSGATQTLPTLYQMATNSTVYANDFHDITTGNNNNSSNTAGYAAGPGYDLVTGLGTPIADNLVPDLAGAVVTDVSSTAANGTYGSGAVIPITITFDTAVSVTGTPELALNSGGTAAYSSGSGSNILTFDYTVAAGQSSAHLDFGSINSLTLNGGTISVAGSSPLEAADLSLMPPAATGSLSANTDIIIANPPTVTAISPTSGPTSGDATVTITGTNFTAASTVNFGSIAATSVVFVSSTSLTAVTPAESPGTVDVTVATTSGTSTTGIADEYTFVAAPTVTGVSPASGLSLGGNTVTITGTNFTATTAVDFGTTPAASFTVTNSTSITATAPAHSAALVDVTVVTPSGTSATNAADEYTFVAPVVTAVSGGGQSALVNTAFAAPLVAEVTNASGDALSGVTVTFAGPGSGAGITFPDGDTATTNAQGQAIIDVTADTSAGSYTVTASIVGLSNAANFALTNNPGAPAAITATFGGGQNAAVNTTFTAPLVATVSDAYGNPVPNATVIFAGPSSGAGVTFPGGDTAITNDQGQASLAVAANDSAGSYTATASVSGVSTPASFTLTNNPFQVVGSVATPNGVVITFNAPVNESTTDLYSGPGFTLSPDVTVVGANTGKVEGSLVIDPTNPDIATFIKTAGLLATDVYTITVTTGVQTAGGAALTSNYTSTLNVTAPTTPVLSVPGFSRGAGQVVDVPNTGSGIPISITNATDVTQASFTLIYDPTLLTIAATGALTPSAAATAAGLTNISYSITSIDAHHSILTVSITGGTGLTAGTSPVALVDIAASVPASAPYFDKAVLNLGNVLVNSTSATGVSGVDEAAYFGDVTGTGVFSSQDASLLLQVDVAGVGTGFSAYKDLDPLLIGNITGNGTIMAQDASDVFQAANGMTVSQLPAIPTGTATITAASWASGIASITVSSAPALAYVVGQTVTISGMTPSGYDGTFIILTVPSTTSFTYALATNPGAATGFGTAANNTSVSGGNAGADPVLYFGNIQAYAGGTFQVSLYLYNDSGSTLPISSLDEGILFDPTQYTVSNVQTGPLLTTNGATGWLTFANIDNTDGYIRIGQSTSEPTPVMNGQTGVVLTFDITLNADLTAGITVPLNLAATVTSNGSTTTTGVNTDAGPLTLNPAPTNASNDAGVDGIVTIVEPPGTLSYDRSSGSAGSTFAEHPTFTNEIVPLNSAGLSSRGEGVPFNSNVFQMVRYSTDSGMIGSNGTGWITVANFPAATGNSSGTVVKLAAAVVANGSTTADANQEGGSLTLNPVPINGFDPEVDDTEVLAPS